mmetsp:Transcript_30547/g.62303  ORF Transcript_30547/g.62303 Transcript_30547/m.62303 type:complete len:201 (-) Transcript_30547:652-1254(-)
MAEFFRREELVADPPPRDAQRGGDALLFHHLGEELEELPLLVAQSDRRAEDGGTGPDRSGGGRGRGRGREVVFVVVVGVIGGGGGGFGVGIGVGEAATPPALHVQPRRGQALQEEGRRLGPRRGVRGAGAIGRQGPDVPEGEGGERGGDEDVRADGVRGVVDVPRGGGPGSADEEDFGGDGGGTKRRKRNGTETARDEIG